MYLFQISSTGGSSLHDLVDSGNTQFSAFYLEHAWTRHCKWVNGEISLTKFSYESHLQAVVHLKLCNERVCNNRN